MGSVVKSYCKQEVVRVRSSHDEEHLWGLEAVIVSDRMTDSRSNAGYSARVLERDELWYFREEDLESTGRTYLEEERLLQEKRAVETALDAAEGVPS